MLSGGKRKEGGMPQSDGPTEMRDSSGFSIMLAMPSLLAPVLDSVGKAAEVSQGDNNNNSAETPNDLQHLPDKACVKWMPCLNMASHGGLLEALETWLAIGLRR